MKIYEIFETLARDKRATIGIGLGQDETHNRKLLNAAMMFLKDFNIKIVFFGNKVSIGHVSSDREFDSADQRMALVPSEHPEKTIVDYMISEKLTAAIRGSLSSNDFLRCVKEGFQVSEVNRLTLLETFRGYQFFYGPVGIDECNTFASKKRFIEKALMMFNRLEIDPKISLLSGGRKGDVGRSDKVDQTIQMAEKLVDHFIKTRPEVEISHDEILIEQAIQNEANLVIAPGGISGNLIYRTLVHLGGGKAYGAIYMGLDKIIIDTSRVGKSSEILGALLLALALG